MTLCRRSRGVVEAICDGECSRPCSLMVTAVPDLVDVGATEARRAQKNPETCHELAEFLWYVLSAAPDPGSSKRAITGVEQCH
jgi:hypothetical protein